QDRDRRGKSMTLRRFAVLAGMVVGVISGPAMAQAPAGKPSIFDTAPPAGPVVNRPAAGAPSPFDQPAAKGPSIFDTAPAAVTPLGPQMEPPPGAQGGFGGPPGGPGGFGGPPPGGGQEAACMQEVGPLREAAEKRANLLKGAMERKADRSEFCKLFKDFAAAEGKVVKFMTDKASTCHIPPQAVTQVKANHDRTVKTRDNVCAAGAAG